MNTTIETPILAPFQPPTTTPNHLPPSNPANITRPFFITLIIPTTTVVEPPPIPAIINPNGDYNNHHNLPTPTTPTQTTNPQIFPLHHHFDLNKRSAFDDEHLREDILFDFEDNPTEGDQDDFLFADPTHQSPIANKNVELEDPHTSPQWEGH
ncbi:hypothetical protein L6452_22321 [Arctium lappa]|uniref:Uncharacterized protein n=1 Tax=Arctium lappa TaxID=4217 RepID=A0ACB9AYM1_ARCLA|nr:hypothetical protein L6452_22321 [Arctium lappa]